MYLAIFLQKNSSINSVEYTTHTYTHTHTHTHSHTHTLSHIHSHTHNMHSRMTTQTHTLDGQRWITTYTTTQIINKQRLVGLLVSCQEYLKTFQCAQWPVLVSLAPVNLSNSSIAPTSRNDGIIMGDQNGDLNSKCARLTKKRSASEFIRKFDENKCLVKESELFCTFYNLIN